MRSLWLFSWGKGDQLDLRTRPQKEMVKTSNLRGDCPSRCQGVLVPLSEGHMSCSRIRGAFGPITCEL